MCQSELFSPSRTPGSRVTVSELVKASRASTENRLPFLPFCFSHLPLPLLFCVSLGLGLRLGKITPDLCIGSAIIFSLTEKKVGLIPSEPESFTAVN